MISLRRIRGVVGSFKYLLYHKNTIMIRDYATTYLSANEGAFSGVGCLLINSNALNQKEFSKIRIDRGGRIIIDGKVSLFVRNNIHVCKNAMLSIGDGTYINEGSKIACKHKIQIGSRCAISNDVSIMDSDFHHVLGTKTVETGVIIGNHCWIGADVSILKNVRIGNDCIIGARTVVTKDIPDNCLAVGNPMRIVRNNINWE